MLSVSLSCGFGGQTHPCIIVLNVSTREALHRAIDAPFALVVDNGELVLSKLGGDPLC